MKTIFVINLKFVINVIFVMKIKFTINVNLLIGLNVIDVNLRRSIKRVKIFHRHTIKVEKKYFFTKLLSC